MVFKSFKELKTLFNDRSGPFPAGPIENAPPKTVAPPCVENDIKLFRTSMAGVKPIAGKNRSEKIINTRRPKALENDPDIEVLTQLKNLVKHGQGFIVADTPEYIEGTGYQVHAQITRRLHRGDFSIQAYIDLHGLGVDEARETFETFLNAALKTGKRAVLIVHGRGLSSPKEPVLKTQVYNWLTRGPWRKWIMAFSSARSCDGGSGATYVLLRQRPVTKRFRKKRRQP